MPEYKYSKKTSTVQEAIILALIIHVVALTMIYFSDEGLFFFSKDTSSKKDVEMEFIELTEELLALEAPETPDIQALLDKYKNVTAKENTETSDVVKSYSFNKQNVDDQVREELLKMEKQEFEKLKKEGVIPEDVQQEDLGKRNQDEGEPKEKPDNSGTNTQPLSPSAATSSYCFASSRNHEEKKDPAYKCISFGQVVIEITVDRDGNVTSAKGLSGDLHKDCLLEESVTYAKIWKFEANSQAPKSEKGTITFTFMPQD